MINFLTLANRRFAKLKGGEKMKYIITKIFEGINVKTNKPYCQIHFVNLETGDVGTAWVNPEIVADVKATKVEANPSETLEFVFQPDFSGKAQVVGIR